MPLLSAELALDLLQDPTVARPGDALAGAPRRGPRRRRGRRRRRSQPRGGRGRGARRPDGQGRRTWPSPTHRRRGASRVREEVVGVFTVENPHGLHARPAARLVSEVRALDASVQLRNLTTGAGPVPAGKPEPGRDAGRRCAATRSRSGRPGPRPRRRSSTSSRWPRAGSTRPTTTSSRSGRRRRSTARRRPAAGLAGHRDRPGPPADRRARRPRRPGGPVRRARRGVATHRGGGGDRTPGDRARPGPDRARGGRRAGRASSTRTCRCSPTPRCSPTSRPGIGDGRRGRRRLGGLPRRGRGPVGGACPTPTCASGPRTSARSASRSSGR